MSDQGWTAVDLDGTLAYYDEWRGVDHVGEPLMPMVNRVKDMLAEGLEVKIFTARVAMDPDGTARKVVEDWCEKHLGQKLEVTNVKDYRMWRLFDDRAVQVVRNEGTLVVAGLAWAMAGVLDSAATHLAGAITKSAEDVGL